MSQEIDELKKMITSLETQVAGINTRVQKIHSRMRWASVYGFFKLLLFTVPLIWAYIFFQPQLQELYGAYGSIMQQFKNLETVQQMQAGSTTDTAELIKQLQKQYPQLR